MEKVSLEPLSGFRDYNNPTKDRVTEQLRSTFQRFGYQPLETPSLERQEILLGKMGDEAQKLLYLFEDNGGRKVGLRYDLTVPLARFVSNNWQNLPLPFKRYEIGTAWRAERAQKGRYRQFTQADVDIVGDSNAIGSEKELIELISLVANELTIPELICLINDRALIKIIFDQLEIAPDSQNQLLILLDKKDKLEASELDKELKKLPFTDQQLKVITHIFLQEASLSTSQITELIGKNESIDRINQLIDYGQEIGLNVRFAPFMVRGLDYYTGIIFECVAPDFPSSLVAGGRYDSLVEKFTGQKLPAVGVSFGVDRLADYLEKKPYPSKTLFLANLPETEKQTAAWALELRAKGKKIERFIDDQALLGKQIKYAAKRGYQEILIPFEDEWRKGKIIRKNLDTGHQETVIKEKI